MTTLGLKIDVQKDVRAYLSARAKACEHCLNSEVNVNIRSMMGAKPVSPSLAHRAGRCLIVTSDDPERFGAFFGHDEATLLANNLVAAMPPGSANLINYEGV